MTIDLSRAHEVGRMFCAVDNFAQTDREGALELYSRAQAAYNKLSPLEKQHAMAILKKHKEQNQWPQV